MEIVEGPARVTSCREPARLLRDGGGTSSNPAAPMVTINISVDAYGQAMTTQATGTDDVEGARRLGRMIDMRIRDVIIREQRQGGLLYREH